MRIRTAGILVVIVALSTVAWQKVPQKVSPAPVAHFAITLDQSATGWSAHCDTGCFWSDIAMKCEGCDVRIDASGIASADVADRAQEGFAFVLTRQRGGGRGWSARGLRGVHWLKLSWGCTADVCRSHIDETGVSGI
jgi:hypothetical protein